VASIVSMTLVLAGLAGLMWWFRRLAARGPIPGRHIQVLETVALGPGKCLHLVRLGDRGLLLACGPQRCELICELETVPQAGPAAGTGWIEIFRQRLGRI